jgi:chromate transporter
VTTAQRTRPGPLELFRVFFRIGLTSFGMAILQNIRSIPVQRGWLSRAEIDEGLGLVQLYPGAIMVDLVAYIGYRVARITGALAAAAGFVEENTAMSDPRFHRRCCSYRRGDAG